VTSSERPASRNPVRVFVSYSHESDEHMAAVYDFYVLLRSQGIDAKLDRPAAERRQDWPAWMLEQVRAARFVLVMASPAYKRSSDGYTSADEGRGVQFEARLIREFFYRDQKAGLERFLPVLLPGVSAEAIPDFLSPTAATHYRVTEMTADGCEALLRVLTDQPYEEEPPLGPIPVLPPRGVSRRHGESRTTGAGHQTSQDDLEEFAHPGQVSNWSPIEHRTPSINVPPRPAYFSSREELLAHATTTLLTPNRANAARMVGLVGMGGTGKSVLARELARDDQIARAYPDGVVWLELGPTPDLLARQAQLAEPFGDSRTPFDWQQGLSRLNMLFAGKARLVVLDNVWKRDHLRAFGLLEAQCTLLITTRNQDIVDRSATIHEIGPLPDEPAQKLLAAWAAGDEHAILPPEANEVVQECGGLPLALAVVGGMVADGLQWEHVRDRLRQADLHKLQINLDDYRDYENLFRAMDASVSELPANQQARYLELAVFDGRGDIPVEVVHRLWRQAGINDLDIKELIIRLSRRSLLQRNKVDKTITLHDLQFDYSRHKIGNQGLRDLHARLAEIIMNDWGGLIHDIPGLLDTSVQHHELLYGTLHLVTHLNEAGQHGDIHHLLALNSSVTTVPSRASQVENAWYVAHERIGQMASYVGDVGIALHIAKTSSDEAGKNGKVAASIGLEVRYALIIASIASIAASIPPQLLTALVKSHHWTTEQGLAYARQVHSDEVKARTLAQLLSYLNSVTPANSDQPRASIATSSGEAGTTGTNASSRENAEAWVMETAAEALVVACGIEDPSSRAKSLSALAPQLCEVDRAGAVSEAWDAVCAIPSGHSRARALAVLATENRLPEILHGQVLTAARAVRDPSSRASILTALVSQFHGRYHTEAIREAQSAIAEIDQPEARAAALTTLIPHLRKPRRTAAATEAWDTIRIIPRGYSRAKALVALAAQLPGPDRTAAVNDAQATIRTISQPEERATAHMALIPQLRGRDRILAVRETQDAISGISHQTTRAAMLTALIPQLPKRRRAAAIKEIQTVISKISQPEERAAAWTALLPQLSEPYLHAALKGAQDAIRGIARSEDRATALTALALQLPEPDQSAMLAQALADARAINDARQRAIAFTSLVTQLPEWDSSAPESERRRVLDRALADARASVDPNSRAITLAILASLMPETDSSNLVRDALKEAAYGVVDAGDRATILAALAPEIPEPGYSKIVDEACAAAREIRDPEQRAAAFFTLALKIPKALERQAAGVAQSIETAFMKSRMLADTLKSYKLDTEARETVLLKVLRTSSTSEPPSSTMATGMRNSPRLLRRKRLSVSEKSRDLADAINELHLHTEALAVMTSENMRCRTEMMESRAAVSIITKIRMRAGELRIWASDLPEPLRDKAEDVIENIKHISSRVEENPKTPRILKAEHVAIPEEMLINESEFQSALTALAFPLPTAHRAEAWDNAREVARTIREPSTQAAALMALLPYLSESERTATLAEALGVAKSINDVAQRARILEAIAKNSLTEPMLPWDPYWRGIIDDSSMRGRAVLISDLSALGGVILRLGGEAALKESIYGLLDVGRWWP
jgi:NB-ARC domain/SEFIR domain